VFLPSVVKASCLASSPHVFHCKFVRSGMLVIRNRAREDRGTTFSSLVMGVETPTVDDSEVLDMPEDTHHIVFDLENRKSD